MEQSTILFPKANGEGALILIATPDVQRVIDGPTGTILSQTVDQPTESERN